DRLVDQLRLELAGPPELLDPSRHRGLAGIGLELLHHLDHGGVAELLAELATETVELTNRVGLPPGLRLGTTGVQLFGQAVRRAGIDCPDLDPGLIEADLYDAPSGADLMIGAAGVGLGHLRLLAYDADPQHLIRARSCASMLLEPAEPDQPPATSRR
ncbi:MAG: hypothetical protein ABI418_00245, partial [Jatrophihabitantaceae bacterium]